MGAMVRIVPPAHLLDRVNPLNEHDDSGNAEEFIRSGDQSVDELTRALGGIGRAFTSFGRVLDWGCGPGRVDLRLIERFPGLDLTGVDPDSGAIEWLSSLPIAARFVNIGIEPPLPFADHSFDLVFNHSVLTHIDREAQQSWLAELARVTSHQGIFVCSVHGAHAFGVAVQDLVRGGSEPDRWLTGWQHSKFLFVEQDTYIGSAHHDGYHTTFQDPSTVEPLSSFWFEPLAFHFRGDLAFQDLLVFQKRSEIERAKSMALLSHSPASSPPAAKPSVRWVAQHSPGYRRYREVAELRRTVGELGRSWHVASVSLSNLGRQVARLENTVGRLDRRIGGAAVSDRSQAELNLPEATSKMTATPGDIERAAT